jgi:hypothetical protein
VPDGEIQPVKPHRREPVSRSVKRIRFGLVSKVRVAKPPMESKLEGKFGLEINREKTRVAAV